MPSTESGEMRSGPGYFAFGRLFCPGAFTGGSVVGIEQKTG